MGADASAPGTQNALTQARRLPKIRAAYLDRLRERPLEAGATTAGSDGTGRNGANSCGVGPTLESDRWAVDCARSRAAMGCERRRCQGLCKPMERAERGRKIIKSNRPTSLRLPLASMRCITATSCRMPRVAYRIVGPDDAPVIAVLGGISAHRVVAAADGDGWWPEIVGRGSRRRYPDPTASWALDYLGGRGSSSTPQSGGKFPPLSSYDQADVLCARGPAPGIAAAARHRGRLVRRNGRALLRGALRRAGSSTSWC